MTDPTPTLRPCPFDCGGTQTVYGDDRRLEPTWKLARVCCSCGVSGPNFSTTAEAISAWNRRALNDQTEALAQWMHERGIATGHGDTVADLLHELAREWNRHGPALRWRSEPPDVPGWWWYRTFSSTARPLWCPLSYCAGIAATPNVEWAGPIPEPEEGVE